MPERLEISDDRALREELLRRRGDGRRPPSIAVTDLLDPRPAYYRRFAAVPLPPERARRRTVGADLHRRWARRVGGPEAAEVRVEREGLVGVVDLLEPDGPTELKTTGRPLPAGRLLAERRTYIDQLGIYCALTEAPAGRLVVVGPEPPATPAVTALRCEFDRTGEIELEARRRAERLRRAIRSRDPGELPRCGWFGRGCPFQEGRICRCRGDEPPDVDWVVDRLRTSSEDPSAADRWSAAIRRESSEPPPVLRGFSDLLWPRRAYFERRSPERLGEPRAPPAERTLAYRELVQAIEDGPVGEIGRAFVPDGDPPGAVPTFRGRPYVVKVYGGKVPRDPVTLAELPDHYGVEAAVRAAATGAPTAFVFVTFLRAGDESGRWRAVEVRPADPAAWRHRFEDGRRALAEAAASGDPSGLPPCPSWMVPGCPYGSECGCGDPPPGS